jgi:DtxR family Mn-dependent transcriptional regulator
MLSSTEENYLKALLKTSLDGGEKEVGTNELAKALSVRPATVNNMLKKLKEKDLVDYEKYGKITLTALGKKNATAVIRKHRIWEKFLYEKLEFSWDEVHEVAEQLEHIKSQKLIDKLDKFLDYPEVDPHGDPIPNKEGELKIKFKKTLANVDVGTNCKIIAVKDDSSSFLKYVAEVGIEINQEVFVVSKRSYDQLTVINVNGNEISVGQKFTENLYVVCNKCDTSSNCKEEHWHES